VDTYPEHWRTLCTMPSWFSSIKCMMLRRVISLMPGLTTITLGAAAAVQAWGSVQRQLQHARS
jgi:hypothetical protein